MALVWISRVSLLVFCIFLSSTNGQEDESPRMENPPLFAYGIQSAGDNIIDSLTKPHEIKLDFNITYYGSSYNHVYISKDGFISFDEGMAFVDDIVWSKGISNPNADLPFIAPFYHEGFNPASIGNDYYHGKILYRVIYANKLEDVDAHYSENKRTLAYFNKYVQEAVINPPKDFTAQIVIVVTWDNVADQNYLKENDCDGTHNNPCQASTFQAVIIADKEHTFAMFNYLKMDVPPQKTHQAGFNGGYGRGWYNVIPCLHTCVMTNPKNDTFISSLPNLKGSDLIGRYFLNVGQEEIIRGGCLPDGLTDGVMEVFPKAIGMFGGQKLEVSGKCLKANENFRCKFISTDGQLVESEGVMSNDMKGYCPVPLQTLRGPLTVQWSVEGSAFNAEKIINVEMPNNPQGQTNERDVLNWFKKETSSITVNWLPETLSTNPTAKVQISIIGYKETTEVEFKTLVTIGEVFNSAGTHTFDTNEQRCYENCRDFEMGFIEVQLVKEFYGDATQRVAHRFGPTPLGWYVNKELTLTMGNDWSQQMCRNWYNKDKMDDTWLDRLPRCPCSLRQALADFGQWEAEADCNMFSAKSCYFHKSAKHCVRSITPTRDYAGNQCCYGLDDELMYSQLIFDGSTPDRAHAWGAYPYNKPGQIPSLSHFKHDVLPYMYCCMWNENDQCELYSKLRPTTDCSRYEVPGLANVRGDPHITTFDGLSYNFGGHGDFWLLDLKVLSIQGRFFPRRDSWDLGRLSGSVSWKPTALTALLVSGSGQPIEIHPAPENSIRPRGIDIRVGKQRYFFYSDETKWQDFGSGQSILNNAVNMDGNPHNNFTIFTNNVGINVVAINNLLHVTVALPPSMKNKHSVKALGMGLLGYFDGYRNNDLVTRRSDNILSPGTDSQKLFENFAMDWAVEDSESLFHFEKDATKSRYTPIFKYGDIPYDFTGAPTDSEINSVCGVNENCKWDYRSTGSRQVATATKVADALFSYSQGSAYKVENCGVPPIGLQAQMTSYNFSVGQSITVTGCGGTETFEGQAKFTCVMETLQTAEDKERLDYGRRVTQDPRTNNKEYLVHWVPRPYEVCLEKTEDANMALIIGVVVAAVVLIILIVVLVCVLKRRKTKSHTPRAAERKSRSHDEDTEEPMMKDRKPIYKESKDDRPESSAV